jgi:hypothetical protein
MAIRCLVRGCCQRSRVEVAYHQVQTFGTADGFRRGNLLEDKLPWVVIDESLPSFQKIPKAAQTGS